jgi:Cu2+-exporting ATPase
VVSLADLSEDEILAFAAAPESQSEHPIAAGIARSAEERGLAMKPVNDFRNLTGEGVGAIVKTRQVPVISPDRLPEAGWRLTAPEIRRLARARQDRSLRATRRAPVAAIALAWSG